MAASSQFVDFPDLPTAPHQPSLFKFPKRSSGKKQVVKRVLVQAMEILAL